MVMGERGARLSASHEHANHLNPTASGSVPGKCAQSRHFFVEVDEMIERNEKWRVTHRLRQGLEMDAWQKGHGLHLPHVSLEALAHLQASMKPEAIALDVTAVDAAAAATAIVDAIK